MKSQAEGIQNRDDYLQEAAGSIWFEIWGVVDPDTKKNQFFQANFREKKSIFQAISQKTLIFKANYWKMFSRQFQKENSIFPSKFPKSFDFFQGILIFFDFPSKISPFTATSGQVILFLFKSHHFRTYFLHMIIFHDPSTTPLPKTNTPT